jgi:hypothetical protein
LLGILSGKVFQKCLWWTVVFHRNKEFFEWVSSNMSAPYARSCTVNSLIVMFNGRVPAAVFMSSEMRKWWQVWSWLPPFPLFLVRHWPTPSAFPL